MIHNRKRGQCGLVVKVLNLELVIFSSVPNLATSQLCSLLEQVTSVLCVLVSLPTIYLVYLVRKLLMSEAVSYSVQPTPRTTEFNLGCGF